MMYSRFLKYTECGKFEVWEESDTRGRSKEVQKMRRIPPPPKKTQMVMICSNTRSRAGGHNY
jgi:hypothetical protein